MFNPLANVIQLAERRQQVNFPAIAQVEAYWHGLCQNGDLPTRAALDPRGLTGALPYTFILERIAPGVARFRVAGHHLNQLLGMEVRGMPITAMLFPGSRPRLMEAIEQVLTTPAVARLSLRSDLGGGGGRLDAQAVLAPVTNQDGEVLQIFGAFQAKGHIGRPPRRFDVTAVSIQDVDLNGAEQWLRSRNNAAPDWAPKRPANPGLRLVETDQT